MVISVPKALDSKLAHDQGQGPYISRFKLPYPQTVSNNGIASK